MIEGGFAAVEAEFAIRIGRDIRLYGQDRSEADLLLSIAALHVASEIAGSPLPTLSDLGPTAVISDHGNNAAVVIGPEIANWRGRSWETLTARTFVNGTLVGEGGASRLPTGGILGSLAFLVNNLAERGRYLKAGDWVATGATTGVHKVAPGDEAAIDFGSDGTLRLKIAAQKKD
ncbi:fumarylacetoacetate hydrolase family protein [Ensifer adhaerens]|uniref:2-keto-4-pentenoate hydratase n=1 Tax=Ensifer adhaerens TaxID=106592 RepID=UPI0023A95D20|nr:fumarylacetoacetate hydrolase family protein [Ensifer adhaerens]WDZ76223.1 fumarylacetoacetate hydrolase family protein [Ensifer adhaerens]